METKDYNATIRALFAAGAEEIRFIRSGPSVQASAIFDWAPAAEDYARRHNLRRGEFIEHGIIKWYVIFHTA